MSTPFSNKLPSTAMRGRIDALKPSQGQPLGPLKMTAPVAHQQIQVRQHRQRHRNHILVSDADVPSLIIDKRHDQKYEKLEFLGEGGFARVYKVKSLKGRYYAAKVIAKVALANKKMKAKVFAEINIHRSLRHNSIAQYMSCFEDRNNIYLVVELCENKTLTDLIKQRRYITEDECRYFLGQILLAIRHMHANRIIHRDLKLSNIFLNKNMDPKIGDFGLAALLANVKDRKKTICGTPNYIAPEILFGNHAHNQAADMWSFGVLMYTLLIGQHPFHQNEAQLIYKKVEENSISNSYTYPSHSKISDDAKDLISHLLVNDPEKRYKVADALIHPFFSKNKIPDRIPVTALRTVPKKEEMFVDLSPSSQHVSRVASALEVAKTNKLVNEMDPIRKPLKILSETILDPRTQYTSSQKEYEPLYPDLKRHDSSDKHERDQASSKRTKLGDKTNTARNATNDNNNNNNNIATSSAKSVPSTSVTSTTQTVPKKDDHDSRIPKTKRMTPVTYRTESRFKLPVMTSMAHNLRSAINEHELNIFSGKFDTRPISSVENNGSIWSSDNIFLQSWVDCTHTYGLAYALSDNTVGVRFNDSTSMTTHDDNQFYYVCRNPDNSYLEQIHTEANIPPELRKKMYVLQRFRPYMEDTLAKAAEQHHESAVETTGVHLSKYIVTEKCIIFRLSNGVIQTNMFKHCKLVLYSKAKKLIYINSDRCVKHYNLLEALASNNKELVEMIYYTADILEQQSNATK